MIKLEVSGVADFKDDELDLDSLSQVTAGRSFLSPEEEANIYQNFSGDNAKAMVGFINQKRALEEIQREQAEKKHTSGRSV